MLWDRDERLQLRPREIPMDTIRAARLVHVDDVDQDAAIEAARIGREVGVRVTSDIDRLTDRTEELVAAVTIPIFAEHVPPALTGKSDPESALRALRRRARRAARASPSATSGALALDGDRVVHSPAFPIHAVDTTGAGDVFRGGFIYATLQGWPIEHVLRFANAAAAVSCTRLGALAGIPSLADVETQLGEKSRPSPAPTRRASEASLEVGAAFTSARRARPSVAPTRRCLRRTCRDRTGASRRAHFFRCIHMLS